MAGSDDEARTTATGLIEIAEATGNPWSLSYALLAYGFAVRDTDPTAALDAWSRGLVIAQDMGIRVNESYFCHNLARLETQHGESAAALDHLTLSIRNYHQSGNIPAMRSPLAVLATLLNRHHRREQAATIIGFALSPLTAGAFPELGIAVADLRRALGEQAYESLARDGAAMTTAAMATYAYDQIDDARTQLDRSRTDS